MDEWQYQPRGQHDWAAFDTALDALPVPRPYGALTRLAQQFDIPQATMFKHLRKRQERGAFLAQPSPTPYVFVKDVVEYALHEGAAWPLDQWERWQRAVDAMLQLYAAVTPPD